METGHVAAPNLADDVICLFLRDPVHYIKDFVSQHFFMGGLL